MQAINSIYMIDAAFMEFMWICTLANFLIEITKWHTYRHNLSNKQRKDSV